MLIVCPSQKVAVLNLMLAAGGALHTPQLVIVKNPAYAPTPQTAFADLVPCTFNGSAAVSPYVFTAPFVNDAGAAELMGAWAPFFSADGLITETITGYAVLNTAGNAIVWTEALVTPVVVSTIGTGILLAARLILA